MANKVQTEENPLGFLVKTALVSVSLRFSRETEPTECRDLFGGELAHVIVDVGKCKICRAGQQAGN